MNENINHFKDVIKTCVIEDKEYIMSGELKYLENYLIEENQLLLNEIMKSKNIKMHVDIFNFFEQIYLEGKGRYYLLQDIEFSKIGIIGYEKINDKDFDFLLYIWLKDDFKRISFFSDLVFNAYSCFHDDIFPNDKKNLYVSDITLATKFIDVK